MTDTMISNKVIFIAGMKGTGKTYLAERISRALYAAGRRLFVLSPHGDIALAGVTRTRTAEYFSRLAGRSVVHVPDDDTEADGLFRFVWHIADPKMPVWIVIDEIPMYMDVRRPMASLVRLVRYGRNKRISIIGTAQRVGSLHKDFIANADVKILFRFQEVNDLAYLRRYVGDVADRLPDLPDRKYITVGM